MPPSVPQVKDVLRQHWKAWQFLGAEGWRVEVLLSSYLFPFYHPPAVFPEPVEIPSYSSGLVKAQALQAEADKMLEKGALEIVDPPGL